MIFDPVEFAELNPSPTIEEYKLDDDGLREWAVQGTLIRRSFKDKAEAYGRAHTDAQDHIENERSRKGLILSVASRNPEGLSERKIHQANMDEVVPSR